MENNKALIANHSSPLLRGRIRKESWGGVYYLRDELSIEILNDTAYEILKHCDGKNTVDDLIRDFTEEYEVNEESLRKDVLSYLEFSLANGMVTIDGLKMDRNLQSVVIDSNINYNVGLKEKPGFFGGKGAIGLEPNVLSAPFKVLIEFTHNCNLKCVHCFADADYCPQTPLGYLEGELTTEQWFKVIDNLANTGVFDIFVSGGEPLIRKDILEILRYVKSKGMGFCLLTNMTLIDDAIAKQLKEAGCYKVEGNMDGYDARTYDEFRGVPGAFDATLKGIKACLDNGLSVRCNITTTKKNIYNLKKVVETTYNAGVRELVAVPLEAGGRAHDDWDNLSIPIEECDELEKFFREVMEWKNQVYGDEFTLVLPVDAFSWESNDEVMRIIDPNKMLPVCGAGKYHCSINPYGQVILCPAAGTSIPIVPGNCLEHDFKDIWLNAEAFKEVRKPVNPACSQCEYKTCVGGCHVTLYRERGVLVGSPGKYCRKVHDAQQELKQKLSS